MFAHGISELKFAIETAEINLPFWVAAGRTEQIEHSRVRIRSMRACLKILEDAERAHYENTMGIVDGLLPGCGNPGNS